jgi:ribulose-phosphate 3-epimerase
MTEAAKGMAFVAGRPKLTASVLTANFAALGEDCRRLEAAGIDAIHWDIMDGVAVPALSFGAEVIAACRAEVALPFEAHIMSRAPDRMIASLARAGCESVTIHPDWVGDPRRVLQTIADQGMTPGVALSPGTPVEFARWHLDLIGLVLVMTVEPGFGGQGYIAAMTEKIRAIAALAGSADRAIEVEGDGGIARDTSAGAHRGGAGRFVVGSALWRAASFAVAVADLRRAASAAGGTDAADAE